MKKLTPIILLALYGVVPAQTRDSIQKLDEVILYGDRFLKPLSKTQTKKVLTDSVILRNASSLTGLLNFNSTIVFRENGLGMVSSPSFRGTTAQQTAVLWNGININSQTTGQTDFNTINARGFDVVVLRAGGGGVVDGTNAIGGSIYLENELVYNLGFNNDLFVRYGSFNTYDVNYKADYSNDKQSFSLIVSRNGSDNDYPYINTDRNNLNGQFNNTNISFSGGIRINSKNELNLYANVYDGKRNFSLPTPNALRTKYYDFNTRSMLEWKYNSNKFKHLTKFAVLTENYRFYPNIQNDFYTEGYVESLVVKYDINYQFNKDMLLTSGFNYLRNDGKGTDIEEEVRHLSSLVLGMRHQVSEKVFYEIGLRQELNKDYESPFLYSAGVKLALSDFYSIKINTSKNFRIPTYNDLYWQGLGNRDLKPEISYQGELTQVLKLKRMSLSVTGYYNSVEDLLMWVPDAAGVWRPENTDNVEIYGAEALLSAEKEIGDHQFNLSATYAYTVSKNRDTGKQLIYVPYHKFTASLGYSFKKLSAYYQYLNNGEAFTTSDNAPEQILNNFMVANLGLEYNFRIHKNKLTLGIQALNLWDEEYESVLNRPMPGRNYNAYMNFNF
ncbi:TonB-dependent siderophore receptor [Winogradskyella sp.]|uniref:TonB-dependent receptor plug domain-containing protein n=1 Tax=Winogradskyella sp. TaxID=1883156 RepID=UPI00261D8AD4|nr:TonB-dependent receptor [Winogradskyella sp.]